MSVTISTSPIIKSFVRQKYTSFFISFKWAKFDLGKAIYFFKVGPLEEYFSIEFSKGETINALLLCTYK